MPQQLSHGNHCQGDRALHRAAPGISIRQLHLGPDGPELPLSLCAFAVLFSALHRRAPFLEISTSQAGKVPGVQHRRFTLIERL